MLAFCMFLCLFFFILLGFPVAFTLAGTAILFSVLGALSGVFSMEDFSFIPARFFGIMSNVTLMAVPLFIFMGMMLEKAGLAKELLKGLERLCFRLPGGLALSVVLVGALLAACTGIVGATVVTMGAISLPTLLKNKVDPSFAAGTIAASGTLGQIVPPSIVLVLLAEMMNVDVGDLFVASLIPSLLLILSYIVYVVAKAFLQPHKIPLSPQNFTNFRDWLLPITRSVLPVGGLIVLVLGSIFTGLASPTESAACGAMGAMSLTFFKKGLRWPILKEVMVNTTRMTTMVFTILLGAQFFGIVFRGLGGDDFISQGVQNWSLSPFVILLLILALFFVLGFFLDFIEVCFILVPIVGPLLAGLGFSPLWLAVLFAINLQTSFLTPPFGFALFYLKGVAPPSISNSHIYKGIVPFVALQLFILLLLLLFPPLVLWLPERFF